MVDSGAKAISSSKGHNLMYNHPFSQTRFLQATDNLDALIPILKSGDLDAFIKIVELEALSLHAMMLTSSPYFILMKPNTLEIIQKIWDFRAIQKIPVCFTLDAGANVHILYPDKIKHDIQKFIDDELLKFCKSKMCIYDSLGNGSVKIK